MDKESKNEDAKKIVGLREERWREFRITPQSLDYPCELGYHCPVCKYKLTFKGNYDERLEWSEYNGFIWCSVCNKDYPSVLCMPDKNRAITIYLECLKDAIERSKTKDGLSPPYKIK